MRGRELDNETLQKIKSSYGEFPKIKKVNFSNNKLKSMKEIFCLFPNVEELILSINFFNVDENEIKEITDEDCEKMWKIENLFLEKNKIKKISMKI